MTFICKRCGACCVLPSGKDCRFLVRHKDGLTSCRIYKSRLYRNIGEGCYCADVRIIKDWINPCPYAENKP